MSTDMVLTEMIRRRRLESAKIAEEAKWKRQSQVEKQVALFLKQHHFEDVNDPKSSCCGLRVTYPLQQAARSKDWRMVLLLLRCGADPEKRDLFGRTISAGTDMHGGLPKA
ncbi:unnamed protein product [Effrenium voratum]|uniref:Uncharacterized protein n=1 Tax=Effrenium voratum TaxID=2562239 RepID=A0AA36J166_9DINO|nr:unnamed protein product [Effrenium voratum]